MAAVSIPPSPHAIGAMAGRRVPLNSLPNGGNAGSPYKAIKTKRRVIPSSDAERDPTYDQPPSKKLVLEAAQRLPLTPKKSNAHNMDLKPGRPRGKAKLAPTRPARPEKTEDVDPERLRAWQRHYKKVFPGFVFYFEGMSSEDKRRCSRQIESLGAKEERFFGKGVTHVITTRPVPTSPITSTAPTSGEPVHSGETGINGTINPILLDKSAERGIPRTKFTFEASEKRYPAAEDEGARHAPQHDVLHKAKAMGMKIWQLEKLQRILLVMLEGVDPADSRAPAAHGRGSQPYKLSQMLKNEQMNATVDRDVSLANNEQIPLKGYFIYIRCMNERTKPIMVRDYAKVQLKEDGEWPQFRSVSEGKCPFVEEDQHSRVMEQRMRAKEEARAKAKAAASQRSKANVSTRSRQVEPQAGRKRPLDEVDGNLSGKQTQRLPQNEPSFARPSAGPLAKFSASRPGTVGGEPMASGMQASNITSAIRSQMISSTAAAPGAKAGTSKEIHGLQRKILERNNGSTASLGRSKQTADRIGAADGDAAAAAATARGKERLAQIEEASTEQEQQKARGRRREVNVQEYKKDPKPGYCENCKEKFDDFDKHTLTKKHRKFALADTNWRELDDLLSQLQRPQYDVL